MMAGRRPQCVAQAIGVDELQFAIFHYNPAINDHCAYIASHHRICRGKQRVDIIDSRDNDIGATAFG
jgi:hypothetical protein